MKVGWNLGNTLDSHMTGVTDVTITEKLRTQPVTQPALMQMMKEAGFGAVRVPVTWYPHMDASGNVDAAWMARVKEVVDYVIGQGMYCIINVHHDGNPSTTSSTAPWLKATMANWTSNHTLFENLWTQIATAFRDYGELLLFEGYNELLDDYSSWNYASNSCEGNYNASVAADAYAAINAYAQSFVDAVRATGGNNAQRNLIVKTYGSCGGRGTYAHVTEPLTEMNLPTDAAVDHLIFGVHAYPRITNTDGTARPWSESIPELNSQFNNLTGILAAKGAPVIITEWGSSNSTTDYSAINSHFLFFADDFVKRCKNAGIAPFYWMGLTDKLYRSIPAFNEPDLAETIVNAYYGGQYHPILPMKEDYGVTYTFQYNGTGQVFLLNSSIAPSEYTSLKVEYAAQTPRSSLKYIIYFEDGTNHGGTNINRVTSTTIPLSSYSKTITRITLESRAPNAFSQTVNRVYLVKSDGTEEELIPTLQYGNSTPKSDIAVNSTPNFADVRITAAHFASLYYSDRNFILPDGIEASAYKVENGRLVCVKTYEADDILPQATGVVLYSPVEGYYMFKYTDTAGEAPVGSMMRGSDTEATTTGGDIYYKLSLNKNNDPGTAGFYRGKADGSAFTNGAHKAYLAVPAGNALASRYYFVDAEDGTLATGIHPLASPSDQVQWFTIDGRPLISPPKSAGIYICNGKKVVVSGN